MLCVSEKGQTNYEVTLKKENLIMKTEEMKKAVKETGLQVRTMHLSADGELSYTMDTKK